MAKHQLTLLDASWTLAGSCKLTRLPTDASCHIDDFLHPIESAGHKIGLPPEVRIKSMCLNSFVYYLIILSSFYSHTSSKIIHLSRHFEPYLDTHLATFPSPKSSGASHCGIGREKVPFGGSLPCLFGFLYVMIDAQA